MFEDIHSIEGYQKFESFRNEFARLRQKWDASKQAENDLMMRLDELKSDLIDSSEKLQMCLVVKTEDERTLAALRKAAGEALLSAKLHAHKEESAQKLVKVLKSDMGDLKSQIEFIKRSSQQERVGSQLRRKRLPEASRSLPICSPIGSQEM
jgi:chromosome segregation ATPase